MTNVRQTTLISDILTDVCELPDRTSPDGQPDLLQVTTSELTAILESRIPLPEPAPDTREVIAWLRGELCKSLDRCRYDMGFDNEQGPIGCRLDGVDGATCHCRAVGCLMLAGEIPHDTPGPRDATIARLSAELEDMRETAEGLEKHADQLSADLGAPREALEKFAEAEARDREPQVWAENTKLRQILSECATAIGNGARASPECSIEFLSWIPGEIAAERKRLNEQLERYVTIVRHEREHGGKLNATIARLTAQVEEMTTKLQIAAVYQERFQQTIAKQGEEWRKLSADIALTREALDRYAALDPDGARAVLAKLEVKGE
jgi:outer membrane murein-binding lipoprotein Lpp